MYFHYRIDILDNIGISSIGFWGLIVIELVILTIFVIVISFVSYFRTMISVNSVFIFDIFFTILFDYFYTVKLIESYCIGKMR